MAEPPRGWIRRHFTRGIVSSEWLRPRRHDRKRRGTDDRLGYAALRLRNDQSLLHAAQSTRGKRNRQLRSEATGDSNSEEGHQRRLALVRAQLLPPLSSCREVP